MWLVSSKLCSYRFIFRRWIGGCYLHWRSANHHHDRRSTGFDHNKWAFIQCYFQLSPGGIPPKIQNPPPPRKTPKIQKTLKMHRIYPQICVPPGPRTWSLELTLTFIPSTVYRDYSDFSHVISHCCWYSNLSHVILFIFGIMCASVYYACGDDNVWTGCPQKLHSVIMNMAKW